MIGDQGNPDAGLRIIQPETPAQEGLVRPEPEPAASELAKEEAVEIAGGKLKRDESIRTHVHRATCMVFWIGILSVSALFLAWVFHLVTPESWHFLTMQQRFDLQTIILSALGSSLVTAMARKWIKAMDEDHGRS